MNHLSLARETDSAIVFIMLRKTSFILARYVGKKFTSTTLITLFALTGLISLFDFIDLLRRAAAHPAAGPAVVMHITALHIPYYIIYILPFAILLGGMICFSRLARSSELVVMRAAGISAWQIILSPVLCASCIGLLVSMGLSPLSSYSYERAVHLDSIWLRNQDDAHETTVSNIWLRENDHSLTSQGDAIFHIDHLQQRGETLYAEGVTVFQLDQTMSFLARIEARQASFSHGQWCLHPAQILVEGQPPRMKKEICLASDFMPETLKRRSFPADTFSLWALPGIINMLRHSGFSTIPYRLHFQGLLALPLLAIAMTLVAAGFSMRPAGRGGIARILAIGVTAGFALFAVSKIAEQLGKSGALPPFLAAWAPAGAGLCLAAAFLLHLEDG